MKEAIILIVLFALACLAYVDMSHFDLLKLIFEFGIVGLYLHAKKKDKTIVYVCSIILVSISYAIIKELCGCGTVALETDKTVGVLAGLALTIVLFLRFKSNAK